jgi:chromosome segregation ATPase
MSDIEKQIQEKKAEIFDILEQIDYLQLRSQKLDEIRKSKIKELQGLRQKESTAEKEKKQG